jgi:tRNA 2-thiouridine synthesizing protein A
MAVEVLDTLGMKSPQPILKIAVKAPDMKHGDILEILGDCPTFERDVRTWCERLGKVVLSVKDEGAIGRESRSNSSRQVLGPHFFSFS